MCGFTLNTVYAKDFFNLNDCREGILRGLKTDISRQFECSPDSPNTYLCGLINNVIAHYLLNPAFAPEKNEFYFNYYSDSKPLETLLNEIRLLDISVGFYENKKISTILERIKQLHRRHYSECALLYLFSRFSENTQFPIDSMTRNNVQELQNSKMEPGKESEYAEVYILLGDFFLKRFNLKEALQCYYRSLTISEIVQDHARKGTAYMRLGNLTTVNPYIITEEKSLRFYELAAAEYVNVTGSENMYALSNIIISQLKSELFTEKRTALAKTYNPLVAMPSSADQTDNLALRAITLRFLQYLGGYIQSGIPRDEALQLYKAYLNILEMYLFKISDNKNVLLVSTYATLISYEISKTNKNIGVFVASVTNLIKNYRNFGYDNIANKLTDYLLLFTRKKRLTYEELAHSYRYAQFLSQRHQFERAKKYLTIPENKISHLSANQILTLDFIYNDAMYTFFIEQNKESIAQEYAIHKQLAITNFAIQSKEIERMGFKMSDNFVLTSLAETQGLASSLEQSSKKLRWWFGSSVLVFLLTGAIYRWKVLRTRKELHLFQQNKEHSIENNYSKIGQLLKGVAADITTLDKIQLYSDASARIYKYLVKNEEKRGNPWTLAKEIQLLKLVIERESIVGRNVNLAMDEGGIKMSATKFMPDVFPGLLHNTLKHGFNNLPCNCNFRIEIRRRRKSLIVKITDNGSASKGLYLRADRKEKGLQILRRRIRSEFAARFRILKSKDEFLAYASPTGGTIVNFRYPYGKTTKNIHTR